MPTDGSAEFGEVDIHQHTEKTDAGVSTETQPELNPHRARLLEVSARTAHAFDRIKLIVEQDKRKLDEKADEPPVPPKNELVRITAFMRERNNDETYLPRSAKAYREGQQAIDVCASEIISDNLAIASATERLAAIDTELESMDVSSQNIAEQVARRNARRRLGQEKEELVARIESLKAGIKQTEELKRELRSKRARVGSYHNDALVDATTGQVKAVIADYETFAHSLIQDHDLVGDIRTTYLNLYVLPQVDNLIGEGKATPDQKDALIASFTEYFGQQDEGQNAPTDEIFELAKSLGVTRGDCEPILYWKAEHMLHEIVAREAAKHITTVMDDVVQEGFVNESSWEDREESTGAWAKIRIKKKLENRSLSFKKTFAEKVTENIDLYPTNDNRPEAKLFQALKETNAVKEIFGDILTKQDEIYYPLLLASSLYDHTGALKDLAGYPRPESVRNALLYLAAGQDGRGMARDVITHFATSPGWQDLLAQTVQQYPGLEQAVPMLEDWKNFSENLSDSPKKSKQLKDALSSFGLGILLEEEAKEDKSIRMMELAQTSLNQRALVDLLVQKGVFSEEDGALFKRAELTIQKLNDADDDENIHGRKETAVTHAYDNTTKRLLLKMLPETYGVRQTSAEEKSVMLAKYKTLAGEIVKHAEDPQALSYFINKNVLSKYYEAGEVDRTLLTAVDSLPILTTAPKLLEYFVKQYNGQETITYFNSMVEANKGSVTTLEILFLNIEKNNLDPALALDLLKREAQDVIDHPNFAIAAKYPQIFLATDESIEYFNKLQAAYDINRNEIPFADRGNKRMAHAVMDLVGKGRISETRSLELAEKFSDVLGTKTFDTALDYYNIFLQTDEDIAFFHKIREEYKNNDKIVAEVASFISYRSLSRENALLFPKHATALLSDQMKGTRDFIFQNSEMLLKDADDIRFFNKLVGLYGQKSDRLIRGYKDCLDAGIVTKQDQDLLVEFTTKFRVIAPSVIEGYKHAKSEGTEESYLDELRLTAQKMVGEGTVTQADRAKPYFQDILRHVYTENAGEWTSYESNDSCGDRSRDLEGFHVLPRYEIDLLSQSIITLKVGQEIDPKVLESTQFPIYELARNIREASSTEDFRNKLTERIDARLTQIKSAGGLEHIELDALTKPEEKLFILLADSLYGTQTVKMKEMKQLMLTHEFAYYQDINDYIAGTTDRTSQASNQEYALLCELHAFYGDRIKEVNRKLVQEAWENPQIATAMEDFFHSARRQEVFNRLQVQRLGMSDAFLSQIGKLLRAKSGRTYTPDQLRQIIQSYENATEYTETRTIDEELVESQRRKKVGDEAYDGMETKKQRKIATAEQTAHDFYMQLRTQKDRTIEAIRVITGVAFDPESIKLSDIDLPKIIAANPQLHNVAYDMEEFASVTTQQFVDIFKQETVAIQGELGKFDFESGKMQQGLTAYITKGKESANARMVGGVCVSGDNPDQNAERNMWDMENYLQVVLQDPESLMCQGLVLMHHFEDKGKRVLAVSLNPSSTYTYSVDEQALFLGLMGTVEQFAADNNFDSIVVSKNKTIRTNRTGGLFEQALDQRIASVNKAMELDKPQQFSYRPPYMLDRMDVVWEKPQAAAA